MWQIKSYGKPQGMLRVDHNPLSLPGEDGYLWFGISDVLTVMDEPGTDTLVPPAYINGLSVNGQAYNFTAGKHRQTGFAESDTLWTSLQDTFYTINNLPLLNEELRKNRIR